MRFRLVPSDDAFFGLFNESAANVAECAHRLRELLSDPTDPAGHEKVAACWSMTCSRCLTGCRSPGSPRHCRS